MILLQVPIPSDLNIGSLTGWAIVVVVALYLTYSLIDKYMTKKKTATTFNLILDRLEEQSKINIETMKYFKTMALGYSDELTEKQCRTFIDKFFTVSSFKVKHMVRQIIEVNHIKGKEDAVKAKIHDFLHTLYISDELDLRSFKYDGTLMSKYMEIGWVDELTECIVDLIYSTKDEGERIKTTQYSVDLKFADIKNHYLNKTNK